VGRLVVSRWNMRRPPSTWQMIDISGAAPYGKPAYLNVRYPFPVDVPVLPEANPTGEYVRTRSRKCRSCRVNLSA
jgi:beta-galactosidase